MIKKLFSWIFEPADAIYNDLKKNRIEEIINDCEITLPKKELITKSSNDSSLFRPLNFNQYIGQARAKDILKSYLSNIQKRNMTMPHILLSGSAGLGKTTLAKIIANELQVNFKEIISSKIESSKQLYDLLKDLDGGVLFLDEAHALSRDLVEPLYPIMEDFKIGDSNTTNNKRITIYPEGFTPKEETSDKIKPFTLIGATTEVGEIIKTRRPFYDRFKIKLELEDYNLDEIKLIINQYMKKTFPSDVIDSNSLHDIASNSRFVPRRAIALLEASVLMGDTNKALNSYQIIKNGYTKKDLKVLEIIGQHPKGVGLQALTSYLGISQATYNYEIEPYLLRNNLILRGTRGRILSTEGKTVLASLKGISP